MKKILIGIFAMMAWTFVSCDKDDSDPEDPTAERTVLIYMAAQNNLTYDNYYGKRYAKYDLEEIKQAIPQLGNDHLVIYVDKAKDPNSSYDDHNPYLLHYRNGELRDSIPMDSTAIPCDPATMTSVIKRAFTDYPAKDYGLVLWGHGSGWQIFKDSIATYTARQRAYGGSNTSNSYVGTGNKWMNIPTLAKVLKTRPHLKFIFADCCNMMCAECAYELKDVCDYFIGSAAEIPGNGAPYDQVVPAMMEKETFYQSICDKYAAKYNDCIPLAVVKSSEMVQLADATMKVLQATKAADNLAQYPNLRNIIYYLDKNLYDINHFIKTYATESEYNSWKQALDKAIIYKKFAKYWTTMSHVNFLDFDMNEENFSGMSMFVPQWGLQNTDNKNIKLFGWYYAAGYDTIEW